MHRFFIEPENIFKGGITITGDDVAHISRVLRLEAGDNIVLCDGNGTDYEVSIESIEKHSIRTAILSKAPSLGEPDVKVTLYQSIPKSTKMDLIIQKCVEIGVHRIVPVISARTIVKLETEKDERKKVERWSKIAEEAAKQSARGIIPIVEMPMSFDKALEVSKNNDISIIPYELEKNNSLKAAFSQRSGASIGIFIGPEGGFEESEINKAIKNEVVSVTLGPRILRTETAGFAVMSCVMYHFDQMQYGRKND